MVPMTQTTWTKNDIAVSQPPGRRPVVGKVYKITANSVWIRTASQKPNARGWQCHPGSLRRPTEAELVTYQAKVAAR